MTLTYVNIINGIRFTHHNPEQFDFTIHFIGHCDTLGFGVDDARTIPSNLQKMINENSDNSSQVRVLNHGVWGFSGNDLVRGFETLKNIVLSNDDIVVFLVERTTCYREYIFDYFKNTLDKTYSLYNNLYKEFCEPRKMPLMIDSWHLSHYGMKRVAECIFKLLKNENVLQKSKTSSSDGKYSIQNTIINVDDFVSFPEDLRDYIGFLLKYKKDKDNIGAVVMNCNPFTKGHRYLIEEAANQVDYLYVFIVEENKSLFSFDNRIKLVKSGTEDLANVIVLPSGKYILSAITFPEYFSKDSLNEVTVDTSGDITIFAKFIAPVLNITKRFVGQEPFDAITRQYNESLRAMLPKYGVEFVEIPRIEQGGEVVSASRVRILLEIRDWESIKELVPHTTFNYMYEHFA